MQKGNEKLMNNFEFLKRIANGVNPITGQYFDEDDILRKPEVSERLLNLAHTLEEDEKISKEFLQENFVYDSEIENLIERSETEPLSRFATKITYAITNYAGREIWHRASIQSKIIKFLISQGKLERLYNPDVHNGKYFATESGLHFGITNELKPEQNEFTRQFLNIDTNVQDYIILNLPEILKLPSTNKIDFLTYKNHKTAYNSSITLSDDYDEEEELEQLQELEETDDLNDSESDSNVG